jgi:hypothetical protein
MRGLWVQAEEALQDLDAAIEMRDTSPDAFERRAQVHALRSDVRCCVPEMLGELCRRGVAVAVIVAATAAIAVAIAAAVPMLLLTHDARACAQYDASELDWNKAIALHKNPQAIASALMGRGNMFFSRRDFECVPVLAPRLLA